MKTAPIPARPEDDHFMTEVLQKSRTAMPFADFEDQVMMQITALEREASRQHEPVADDAADVDISAELRRMRMASLRLSWFFFLIGLAAGIALLLMTPSYSIGFLGFQGREAWILIQGTCLMWLLMQAERLVLLTKEYLDRNRDAGSAGSQKRTAV